MLNVTDLSARAEAAAPSSLSHLNDALRRAHRVLWQTQRPDGSWDSPGEMGPSPTAQVVVALQFLGQLSREDGQAAAKWLRSQQRKDGSFVLYPFARHGDLGATACAWAAMHVAAPEQCHEAIAKARQFILRHGGVDKVIDNIDAGDVAAVFLALAGLIEPSRLPCPPIGFLLVPPLVRALETRFHDGVLMMAGQLNVITRRLRGEFGRSGTDMNPLEKLECKAVQELLLTFQNRDGSWNANVLQGALALAALHCSGMPLDAEPIRRGVAWIASQRVQDGAGVHYDAFFSGVWSTAFNARALMAAGVAPGDKRISSALHWLVDAQLDIAQPAANNRHKNAPRTGGWAFQKGNHTMADCDDAGVVLSALGMALAHKSAGGVDAATDHRLRSSISRGRDWLLGMQNPDGGWSAFVWGLPPKRPGPAMTKTVRAKMDQPLTMLRLLVDPEPALGDPSTEDLTARVLHGLGQCGFSVQNPEVGRAVEFLRKQQCDHGGWWGRWVVNDLAATAFVLMGLRAVGVDMRAPWVQRAVRWTLSKQNPDGGWGELVESYADPSKAGQGPSMAPLTGLVLQGLLDAGEGGHRAVRDGVEFLLRRQHPDGTWPNDDYLHANVPPDTFYCLAEATKYYPAEALARYAAYLRHPPAPKEERWSDLVLDAARGRTDLVADKVISAIFARGDTAAVNELLTKMFRSDDPVPPGMPPEAAAYFEATGKLPPWADPALIAKGQQLFTRAGWEVATALFCSSLPQAYAAAKGARVLTQTGVMTKHIKQRIFETAQFLFDVLDEGGLSPTGRGIRTTQKIRLMHGAIRHMILHRPAHPWDAGYLGLPINQEDLAGTLLTFSVVTLDALGRLGVPYTSEEAEAWMHTWKCVGYVLGIEEGLLPRDVSDAHALMDAIRERQWAPSADGRALIKPLVELMQDFIPGDGFDGIPVALMRHLAGDHCADILGLPGMDWTRLLIETAEVLEPVMDIATRELGLSKVFFAARQDIMHAIAKIEREGKDARFRIPTSLKRVLDA